MISFWAFQGITHRSKRIFHQLTGMACYIPVKKGNAEYERSLNSVLFFKARIPFDA